MIGLTYYELIILQGKLLTSCSIHLCKPFLVDSMMDGQYGRYPISKLETIQTNLKVFYSIKINLLRRENPGSLWMTQLLYRTVVNVVVVVQKFNLFKADECWKGKWEGKCKCRYV